MKTKKKSFILYDDDIACVSHLTTKQAGKLLQAIVNLRINGEVPDFGDDAALKILFHQITTHIALNEEKYQKTCEKNAEIARKRWNSKEAKATEKDANTDQNVPENANAYEEAPKSTKRCYNDNENKNKNENNYDYDNKNVNVNDNVNKKDNGNGKDNERSYFSTLGAFKKPNYDMSSVENFFASAASVTDPKPHRGSS